VSRKFTGSELLIASGNSLKVDEFKGLFAPLGIKLRTIEEFPIPEPIEDGETYLDNALIKARDYVQASQIPTIADDSGLEIVALGNIPGIYSARFAASKGGYPQTFEYLEKALEGKDKTAYVNAAIVLMWPDMHYETGMGRIPCDLVLPPRIEGRVFDPMLQPKGYNQTFAENPELKSKIGHRAMALQELMKKCFDR